ncbi:C45 family autoproteolytic acyltransferase/hydolase [Methylobacterium platani]|uniref:Peptidase C45 n=2 Tax=Methylobacterium platani TaxID=427683 RepID=A0A179SAQ6_9HYPH|nr:C45 family peptidase [Methylobacterium platani]KMO21218.1 peptidase C45 [Methylobacterium platani JCM 14648]OAS24909.1 peptidase C45 [Methylobacterium platani]
MFTDRTDRLRLVEAAGSPNEIGLQLGRFGAAAVHGHLVGTRAWAAITAHRHDERVQGMAAQVRARFPAIMAEIEGLAEGLGLPVDAVFAWNCRGDIAAMAPDGCTTVQVPGAFSDEVDAGSSQKMRQDQRPGARHDCSAIVTRSRPRIVVAHNEDGDPGFRGACGLLRARPDQGIGFTAFVYPGSIPGHTFAATEAGLVQTVNNIRSRRMGDGLPRMVLTRAVLDCASLDAAVALVGEGPRAGAFHLTLAQSGDPRLLGVEFTGARVSVRRIAEPALHANHLVHADMADEPQIVTDSSGSRQVRGDALVAQGQAERDPLATLRDTGGEGLPIRRDDPHDPDDENTLATAVFVIEGDRLDWSVHGATEEWARFTG